MDMAEENDTHETTGRADAYSQKPPGPPVPVPPESKPGELDLTPSSPGAIGDDIAKILEDVKLPERRGSASSSRTIENKAASIDSELASAIAQEGNMPAMPEPSAAITSAPPSEQSADPNAVSAVHTFKDDLQHVVRDEKVSFIRAASLEEDRRARKGSAVRSEAAEHRSRRLFGVLFGSLLLLVLGGAALFGVYTVMIQKAAAPAATSSSSILFAEQSVAFPIDGQSASDLKQALAQARGSTQGALGSIIQIIPTVSTTSPSGQVATRPATLSEFMAAIGANPPPDLLRALSDQFFFGFHTVDTEAPLFVIPVTSYDHAFAGMLAWESTMNADLAPIFTAVPTMTTDSNGLPTTRTFQDDVMRNYDVRELKNDAGQVELYYSFPTQNILVIAESPYSFTEILSRLQAAREL